LYPIFHTPNRWLLPKNACTSILQPPDNSTKKKSHASESMFVYPSIMASTINPHSLGADRSNTVIAEIHLKINHTNQTNLGLWLANNLNTST
jgi:hypothetical protein